MALTLLTANNAQTVLAAGLSASATTLTVNTGTGNLFPSPVSGTSFFKLTLIDAATGQLTEILHVTARAGDVMTVDRAQEGTTARAWSVNDIAANMMTSGTLSFFAQNESPAFTGTPTAPTPATSDKSTKIATTAFVAARAPNMARFTSSGSWTCPAGVTTVYISGGGGGGGGGGGNGAAGTSASSSCGGGGGAGQCVLKTPLTVVPGNVYAITIGAGGTAGNGGATGSLGTNGGDGGSTVFGSLLTLAGGGGGQAATTLAVTGGIGGTYGGVDGGGGSTSSAIYSVGGAGGSSPFGTAPGASRTANSSSGAAGRPGQGYCSGGGGGGGIGGATSGTGSPGNAGLPGILILEW